MSSSSSLVATGSAIGSATTATEAGVTAATGAGAGTASKRLGGSGALPGSGLAGAGVGFTFAEIYTLRGEYQRVFDAGDDTVGEGDQDLVTVGVTVKF